MSTQQHRTPGPGARSGVPGGRLAAALAALGVVGAAWIGPWAGATHAQEAVVSPPQLMVVDAEPVTEGNALVTRMRFPVVMSQAPAAPVSVVVSTVGLTATEADQDFQPIPGRTLEFRAGGPLVQFVDVLVNGDTKVEGDERLGLLITQLSAPVAVADNRGEGVIKNDDAPPPTVPALRVDDAQTDEPPIGPVTAKVRVTVAPVPPADRPVSVRFLDVEGTATEPEDYDLADGTLQFTSAEAPAGATSLTKEVSVTIKNDGRDSSIAEEFRVRLLDAVNAAIERAEATVRIFDADDIDPCLRNPKLPGCEPNPPLPEPLP